LQVRKWVVAGSKRKFELDIGEYIRQSYNAIMDGTDITEEDEEKAKRRRRFSFPEEKRWGAANQAGQSSVR
jgi:hypothetical protein